MINHARWYFNVTKWNPTREDWLRLTSSIAQEESERIIKFVYQDDSKSSLIGCALIRKFLTEATNASSNEPVIIRSQHGRPEVCKEFKLTKGNSWPAMIDFNVSHSGDYCVLAGVWSSQQAEIRVGVDVNKIVSKRSKPELERFLELMSRREFTKAEWDTVEKATSDRQKCINFTRLWCLKESYIKSTGLGLSFKLDRIDFKFSDEHRYSISMDMLKSQLLDDTSVLLDGKQSDDWHFYETALDDEHIVALGYNVISSTGGKVNLRGQLFKEVKIESLVNTISPMREIDVKVWEHFTLKAKKTR